MRTAFFGQYLLDKGIIDFRQLANAIELQEKTNLRIGDLIIEKKLLSVEQVKQILNIQKQKDLYFGEAAQELGLLTAEQVKMLLEEQKKRHIYIGEAIAQLGYLSEGQLKDALAEFVIEQNENAEISAGLYPCALRMERYFIEQFVAYTSKIINRMGGIVAKYAGCEVVKKGYVLPQKAFEIEFKGDPRITFSRYILALDKEMSSRAAKRFYEGCGIEVDESSVLDSMSEIINMICAQICGRFEEYGSLRSTYPQNISSEDEEKGVVLELSKEEKAAVVYLATPHSSKIVFVLIFPER